MPPNRMLPRWAFAGATGVVITFGHIWVVTASPDRHYNAIFFGVLLVALTPVGLYAIGLRSRTTPILRGSLLLIVTAGAWLLVAVSNNDFRTIPLILAWPAIMAVSLWPPPAARRS